MRRVNDLIIIEDFIAGAARREEIRTYLAICEATDDEATEKLREELSSVIDTSYYNPSEKYNQQMETLWTSFRGKFAEHFAVKHDEVMRSHFLQEKVDEIQRSDSWWEFENLSSIPIIQGNHWRQAREICREFRQLDCRFDIREMLQIHPFCACSFTLARTDYWEHLPQRLLSTISDGLLAYRKIIFSHKATVVPMLEAFIGSTNEESSSAAVVKMIEMFKGDIPQRPFTTEELQVLHRIFEHSRPSDLVIELSADAIHLTEGSSTRRDTADEAIDLLGEVLVS